MFLKAFPNHQINREFYNDKADNFVGFSQLKKIEDFPMTKTRHLWKSCIAAPLPGFWIAFYCPLWYSSSSGWTSARPGWAPREETCSMKGSFLFKKKGSITWNSLYFHHWISSEAQFLSFQILSWAWLAHYTHGWHCMSGEVIYLIYGLIVVSCATWEMLHWTLNFLSFSSVNQYSLFTI